MLLHPCLSMFRSKFLQMNRKDWLWLFIELLFVETAIFRNPTVCILLSSICKCQSSLNVKLCITHLNNNDWQVIPIFVAFLLNKYVLHIICVWKYLFYFIFYYTFRKCCSIIFSLYRIELVCSWKLIYGRDLRDIIIISSTEIIKMSSKSK